MYSVEYICTHVETDVINSNIIAVIGSNIKPKDTVNDDRSIQVHKCKYVDAPLKATSYNITNETANVKKIDVEVNNPAPFSPTFRPNNPDVILLINGKINTNIYILLPHKRIELLLHLWKRWFLTN
jgi:hypothetical protein